jgi:hypothetical protein
MREPDRLDESYAGLKQSLQIRQLQKKRSHDQQYYAGFRRDIRALIDVFGDRWLSVSRKHVLNLLSLEFRPRTAL